MSALAADVHSGAYPSAPSQVEAAPEVVADFRAWLDQR